MYWSLLISALLASATAKPPLQVAGCALLANPGKFDGKLVQFVAHPLFAIDTLDYRPFGCDGKIGISMPVVMHDHRKLWDLPHPSGSGLMLSASKIRGRLRVERDAAIPGHSKAMTYVMIDDAVIDAAGYRRAEAAVKRR